MSRFRQRTGSSRWVAIAAAYLLVLQAVFVGLASGAHAAGMSLDRSLAIDALRARRDAGRRRAPTPARRRMTR